MSTALVLLARKDVGVDDRLSIVACSSSIKSGTMSYRIFRVCSCPIVWVIVGIRTRSIEIYEHIFVAGQTRSDVIVWHVSPEHAGLGINTIARFLRREVKIRAC